MPMISTIGRKATSVRLLIASMYGLLLLGAVTMVYPFLIMISGTTKSSVDLNDVNMIPAYLHKDEALFQKHMEGLFNERVQFAKTTFDQSLNSFNEFTLAPINASGLLEEWTTFLTSSPPSTKASFSGYMHTPQSLTAPSQLRKLKKQFQKKYQNDIAQLNSDLGVAFINWNAFYVNPPFPLPRIKSQRDTPWSLALNTFSGEQSLAHTYWFSVEGFFRRQFLETRYTSDIQNYNKAHSSPFSHYKEIALPRQFPQDASLKIQEDWELFVRKILHLQWIRLAPEALKPYQHFLQAKYSDINSLNQVWRKNLNAFDNVTFPENFPSYQAADLDAFISGWTDPLSQQHFEAPIKTLTIHSVEFLFRDYLMAKHGNLEQLNNSLGTSFQNVLHIAPPQFEQHLKLFPQLKNELRKEFTTRNFVKVIDFMVYHGRGVWNTFIYCALSILLALLVNPLAAYALSRYRLKNSYTLLFFMLITMAFPPMVTQIPVFIMLRDLNMLNTFAALVLPGMAHGYSIFLLKGFFDSLPRELYENAAMDGAGEWTLFWSITMSLSKPILAVIALSAFTAAYSNFMFALLLCQDEKMWTIMVWLYQLQMNSGQGVIYASLLLAALPTFLVFAFCQNIIMRGIVVPSEK